MAERFYVLPLGAQTYGSPRALHHRNLPSLTGLDL